MPDQKKAILLRISPELWAKLNRWAADELRSVNAQIEYILRAAVQKRSGGQEEANGGEADPTLHHEGHEGHEGDEGGG